MRIGEDGTVAEHGQCPERLIEVMREVAATPEFLGEVRVTRGPQADYFHPAISINGFNYNGPSEDLEPGNAIIRLWVDTNSCNHLQYALQVAWKYYFGKQPAAAE